MIPPDPEVLAGPTGAAFGGVPTLRIQIPRMKRLLFLSAILVVLHGAAARLRADAVIVFNEIMYHPATNESLYEWVELRNLLACDVDISDWSIGGDIQFSFPSNSIIKGGGYLVVARSPTTMMGVIGSTNVYGPFFGRLENSGGALKLHNNSGRVMDEVHYDTEGDWPVAPDGSGVSLAKRDPDTAGSSAANWTSSEQMGGTPGARNFLLAGGPPPETRHIAVDSAWRYDASGADLSTAWRATGYNDSTWASRHFLTNQLVADLFNTGLVANGTPAADGASDPHYVLSYTAQGTPGMNAIVTLNHPAWAANDNASKWISVVNPGTTTINGGGYGYRTTFSLSGFILNTVQITFSVAIDNAMTNVFLNGAATGQSFTGFASFSDPFNLTSGFVSGTNTLEFGTENQGAGPGGFRALVSGAGLGRNTNSPPPLGPVTYYFRRSFNFVGDPAYTALKLNAIVTDGAVFYLNGVEVRRYNLPGGAISASTPAQSDVTSPAYLGQIPISAASLVSGTNVLAVEVHQAVGSADGPLLGVDLVSTPLPTPPTRLAFNELSAATNAQFWLELVNYGTNNIQLEGYAIVRDGPESLYDATYVFPAGQSINAGGYRAVTNTTLGFHPVSGDRLYLLPPARDKVLDSVVVKNGARARSPDGTGDFLRPTTATPGGANNIVFHNEIVINEIMYDHKLLPATNNLPPRPSQENWLELYNKSGDAVDLTGWELDGGIGYHFSPGQMIAAGGYLVVADDAVALRALYPGVPIVGDFSGRLSRGSDHLILRDPTGNPADEVRYFGGGHWPQYANGGGSSLELRDPNADNSKAEAWAASDESGKSAWQTFTYRVIAAASPTTGPDTQWRDFVFGLQDVGECLVDDISVIESPTTAPVQFIANGNFESDITGWRVLGTHNRSHVIVDPDNPNNHVLHVIVTGYQEHMHNHIETTITGGRSVVNGRQYEVSFRAKWVAGNNLLNTRLYFNRAPRTTVLPYPTLNGTPGAANSRLVSNIGPTFSGFGHQPVVPQPGSPVTVSVVAQDPQGVASAEVWWSVNSGTWNSAAMTPQGGGVYTGAIPGASAGAIVQFYVRAVDGLGAAATFPALGTNSGALYAVADGQANLPLSHNVRIVMTPSNTDLLHGTAQGVNQTNVMSNDFLPCTVIYDEARPYYDCGVHLRGSERGRYSDTRTGFHIVFQPDDLFRGVHPVMLIDRSGAGDATGNRQEEIILKHMLNRAGGIPGTYSEIARLIAPRAIHTGPCQFFPRHEDNFLETAFENGGDGTLFEMELIYWPTTANAFGYKNPQPDSVQGIDLANFGDDKEPYRYNFLIKNHRDTDNYNRFIQFCKAMGQSGAAFEAQTRQVMDLDQWMRAYAMVSLGSVGDMYTFGNNHNMFIYQRPSDGKMLYFPWDMDFTFTRGASGALVGDQNLGRLVSTVPANLRCMYAHMLDIIGICFNTNYMAYWTDHYDNFAPGQSYAVHLANIGARVPFVISTINSAGGNAPFNVSGTNLITTSSNLITLSGTAPVQVKTIRVNGVEYDVIWTSVSAWTLRVPIMVSGQNTLNLVGYDVHGNVLTNFSRTITVIYTGPTPVPQGTVVINEIMYNSAAPDAAFIELYNNSANTSFDLSGWRLNGLDYTFPSGTVLTNRGFLAIANNPLAYSLAYTSAPPAFDRFSGNLKNDGETISLFQPGAFPGEEILVDRVRYESGPPWPAGARGLGASLQLIDATKDNARVANWSDGTGWRFFTASTPMAGPGLNPNILQFFLQSAGDLYVDDVKIVLGSVAEAGTNLLTNGSFELGLDPWRPIGNHTNSVVVTGIAHEGSNSLHIIATGQGGGLGAVSNMVNNLFSTNLATISFWYLPSTNGSGLNFRVTSAFRSLSPIDYRPGLPTPGTNNAVAASLAAFPPVWLNEVQPENLTGLTDNHGEHEPWVEIYNAGSDPVLLNGWYLSTSYESLNQWAFPSNTMLMPGEFKVVICDNEENESTPSEWHTNFRLSPTNGSVALSWSPAGVQILDYLNYADIRAGRAYGDFPDGQPFYREEFYHPTPGATNDHSAAPLTVFINEWMAQNSGSLLNTNNNNQSDDWFEIYNPNNSPADLSGFFLTDNLLNPDQFQVPPGTIIPAHGFLLVWADGKPGLNTNTDPALHVSFKLEQNGESIGLFGSDGAFIDAVTFGPQYSDISEGRYPDGPAVQWVAPLTVPTPGAPNALYANRYPVLAAIPNATAYVNLPFEFTAAATDPDVPPQSLIYTIEAGGPTNATLNPATGAFSWTPTLAQADTTNVMTLRVTDNGTPSLHTDRTFTVIVRAAVVLGGITAGPGGMISFTVLTQPGKTYRVEYKNALTDTMWIPLPPDHPALGTSLTINDTIGPQPQRFYRVVQLD